MERTFEEHLTALRAKLADPSSWVDSSWILRAAWSYSGHYAGKMVGTLVIQTERSLLMYLAVPINVYGAFRRSKSKGMAYHRLIKGQFYPLHAQAQRRPKLSARERRMIEDGRKFGLHRRPV